MRVRKVLTWIVLILVSSSMLSFSVFATAAKQKKTTKVTNSLVVSTVFKMHDLNYRYSVNYVGVICDYSTLNPQTETQPLKKVLIEITLESLINGFNWYPTNPQITDNQNRLYHDYQVIVGPPSGNKVTIKYLINTYHPDTKSFSLVEDGISVDGTKSFHVALKNLVLNS